MEEETPLSLTSPGSPMPEGAPMAPGEASAEETPENKKQESIDNIVQVMNLFFSSIEIFFLQSL